MKSLTRLTILVVVLAVLTLATGVAYAGQLEVGQLADIFSSEKNRSPESQGLLDRILNNTQDEEDDDEIEIIGTVMSISDTTLMVDETEIALTAETIFEDEVAVGDVVKVEAYYADGGILTAMKVELYEDDDDEEVEIIGTVMSISDTTLVVDETEIALTADTVFEDEVAVGDMVKVEAYYDEDGILTAMKVELYEDDDEDEYFKITGTVTSLTAEVLVVDETEIALTADTIFKDEIAVGDIVKVVVYYAEDGTLTAHKVELYEENGNGNGFGYSIKVKLVGEVESYAEDSIVVSGITIAITETTKIKGDIMVGDIVRVHAFMAEDGSLTAWKIKLLPDAVANPGNADKLMVIGGVVESLSSDSIVVSGITFAITSDTRIKGTVEVGDFVTVKAFYDEDGSVIAKQIIQVRGCWDGDTFVRGDDSKCVHGEERGGSDVENPASEKQDVSNTKSVDKLKGYEKDKVKENKDK